MASQRVGFCTETDTDETQSEVHDSSRQWYAGVRLWKKLKQSSRQTGKSLWLVMEPVREEEEDDKIDEVGKRERMQERIMPRWKKQ